MTDEPRNREIALGQVRDADGFAPIGQYAVLGDGRGAALVAADGRVDWWATPRLDDPPAFAAVLDPEHGGWISLRPVGDATVERQYLAGTNQLRTVFTCPDGTVQLTDSLNTGQSGPLPWSELARRVDGLAGRVELELEVRPGTGLESWEPWSGEDARGALLHAGPFLFGVRVSEGIRLHTGDGRVRARFSVAQDQRLLVGVIGSEREPLFLCSPEDIDARVDSTTLTWRRWSDQVSWPGEDRPGMVRSGLALKTLVMDQTGAVAAAVSTSLPERVGGPKNWDYRFSWIRDAAMTIEALGVLGLQEEVHAAVTWLLRTIRRNGPEVHVLYTLDGELPHDMSEAPVSGYRDSRPVRVGNAAAGQTQLGVYGDLFGTVADWVFGGHVLDVSTARELADIADRCADLWRNDDAGIWELGTDRPYTSSKMNCWRALDAAARMAEAGHLPDSGRRWRAEADRVRRWVQEHCWSEEKGAYTFYAGTEELDASVLLGAQMGFDVSTRMSSTIDALTAELAAGPLIYRYSGVADEEETFLACAYWRVHALVCVGRVSEAAALADELEALVPSPLGLMTEMAVEGTGELVGNMPQALSHLAHIRAAHALREAKEKH